MSKVSKDKDIRRLEWLIDQKRKEFWGEGITERDIRKAVYKDILEGFTDLQEAEEHIRDFPTDSIIFTAQGWEVKFSLIKIILNHIRSNPWFSPWEEMPRVAPMTWFGDKLKEMQSRQGKCYELAWRHAAFGEGTLVHGELLNPRLGRMMDHAWVITQTGYVYEPVSDLYFEKDDLYKTFKLKELNTYTPTEARKMALVTKTYGPWTDEERRKVVPQTTGGSKVRELLFSKKEDAEQSVEDYMAILPSDLRDKRVSRVWFDPSVGYWRAGIYIKEVINPAPQVGSQDNLLQYYKVPPGAS